MVRYERTRRSLSALGAGAFTALALPPWGWWPLLFVGITWFLLLTNEPGATRRSNVGVATLWTIAWLAPAMWWMKSLSIPGYILAVLAFAGFHALAELVAQRAVIHSDTTTLRHRLTVQVFSHTLAEMLRFSFPFGGVPLASFGIALVSSPFAYLARFGGAILLTLFGFAFCALIAKVYMRPRRKLLIGMFAFALCAALLTRTSDFSHRIGQLRVAVVQGGGEQGTHAIDSDPRIVFDRHIAATKLITTDDRVDVVVWPENVIDVAEFTTSDEAALVSEEAERLGVPILVGVTEDATPGRFLNAQIVVNPDGTIGGRYDKVRRVPFGEYMPLRGLLKAFGAPVDLVPNDAVAGTGTAVLHVADTTFAVAISWEIFFGGRVNEGVEHGGRAIINPTNGSSYTGTILQSQQIASSRLRAIEQSRWVAQVSPTGFSAIVNHEGNVRVRSGVSEQRVIIDNVELRSGRTPYSRTGDAPIIILMFIGLAGTLIAARKRAHISAH